MEASNTDTFNEIEKEGRMFLPKEDLSIIKIIEEQEEFNEDFEEYSALVDNIPFNVYGD